MRYHSRIVVLLILTFVTTMANAQSWKNEPDMKVKRAEAATVLYNGELYAFNGFSRGLFVGNSVEKYNPNSNKWTLLGNTSVDTGTAVTHTANVLVGADVWLMGGRVGAHPGRVTDAVWIYNLQSNQWRAGPKLPKVMAGGGAAVVNNKIYIFGGVDSQAKCDVNYHYEYNLGSPSSGWKNLTDSAAMPSPRNHFSTVTINNLIYAIGGQNGHDGCPGTAGGNVALVHTFNPANKKWNRVASLPATESHSEPGTFVHNGFIYSIGGNGAGDKVVRYDPGANNWEQVATLPEKLVAPIARIFNARLVVAGGGAPITSKSKITVRSLTSSKFNDVASGATASDSSNSSSDNDAMNTSNNDDSNNTNDTVSSDDSNADSSNTNRNDIASNDNTSDSITNNSSSNPEATSTEVITVSGSQISWPNDGWYQVQNENGYSEVCAGGRSCEVPPGSYVVINHNTGQRFTRIQVGGGQSTNAVSSNADSPIVVSDNVISWPNNGWYQVQDARDYSEVCAGGSSCTVSAGTYNVINHDTGARYDAIVVSANSGAMAFGSKLGLFEQQASLATNKVFLNINQQYISGSMEPAHVDCIASQYSGLSIAPVVGCSAEQLLENSGAPITQFSYEMQALSNNNLSFEDEVAHCRASLAVNSTTGCSLSSVNFYHDGRHIHYGTSNRAYSDNRSIIISDDLLDVSGLVSITAFDSDACFMELKGEAQWSLLYGSDLATCDQRLSDALSVLD